MRIALIVVIAALAIALAAPAALASKGVIGFFGGAGPGSTGGLMSTPRGVAVNRTTGDVYVADAGNNRIQVFDSSGTFVRAWGLDVVSSGPDDNGTTNVEICLPADTCKAGATLPGIGGALTAPRNVAIDQSDGSVYVSDGGLSRRIQKFTADGAFVWAAGWNVVESGPDNDTTGDPDQFETCIAANGDVCRRGAFGADAGQFGVTGPAAGIAVNPDGQVLVAARQQRVQVFSPTGAFVSAFGFDVVPSGQPGDKGIQLESCPASAAQLTGGCQEGEGGANPGQFSDFEPTGLATDSSGSIYTVEASDNNRVQRFTPSGSAASVFAAATLSGDPGPTAVAVDTSSDHVYVVKACDTTLCPNASVTDERRVRELDSAGTPVDVHASSAGLSVVNGIGIDPARDVLYLSSTTGGDRVYVLGSLPPPTTAIDPGAGFAHTGTTATFTGMVNPTGNTTRYHFEYSADGADWTALPDVELGFSDDSDHPVAQDASGLTGSQLYHVRLVATKPFLLGKAIAASATSAETTFTTDAAAPAISALPAANLTDTTATLRAKVDPQHQPTRYHFEYGAEGPCDANPCASAPADEASAGSGGGAVAVARDVSGLQPATAYHFRLVATNSTGTTQGPDTTFTTYPARVGSANCPNDAFLTGASAHLSDCRAYELVTPPETNGSTILAKTLGEGDGDGGFETTLISPAGDSAIFQLRGTLPGFPGAGVNDVYSASRGPGGWSTATLTPSGAQSELPLPGGVSPDHRYGFWSTSFLDGGSLTIGGQATRYVRGPDGSFELIGRGSLAEDPQAIGRLITAGAGHIVFTSELQLEPGIPAVGPGAAPPNTDRVAAVYDRTPGGPTRVVSLLPGDVTPAADTTTYYRGVAVDGSAVVFSVDNTMYVRRGNATTVPVASAASPDALAYAGVSTAGGDRVFYVKPDASFAPGVGQLFAFDADSEATTSITPAGGAQVVNISADGSHAYFVSPEQLDGDNGTAGAQNLYVWDGSGVRFIAVVQPVDVDFDGANVALGAWTPNNGAFKTSLRGLANEPSRTTADGSVFVFQSTAQLTGYDNTGHIELYRYDADTDSLVCVSCNPTGGPATSDARLQIRTDQGNLKALMPVASLSSDGEAVYFESADELVPQDTNSPCAPPADEFHQSPCTDVYEWKDGHLSLISSGHSSTASSLWGVSPDGHDVLFRTADPLVPQDPAGGEPSLYDARVGGGFPAESVAPGCVEDACEGDASVPAPLPTVATVTFAGLGNATVPRPGAGKVSATRPKPVRGFAAKLRVKVPSVGVVTVSGKWLRNASKRASQAGTITIPVRLTAKGRRALRRKRSLKPLVRLGFRPATDSASVVSVRLRFRRPVPKTPKPKTSGAARHTSGNTTRRAGR